MFTVTVELLTGRYVATQFNDRSATEWPPHPARLFSAAVAAWADHGDMDATERAALEWWEALEPPTIRCSIGEHELAKRSVVTHFVPVNDISVVARDTVRTYDQLVTAEAAVLDGSLDDKQLTKATKRLEKARAKAADDSRKATTGVAPSDRVEILPQLRPKQPREYPTMIPADPTVDYHWNVAEENRSDAAGHLDVLADLLSRIPRLGHSSTPVAVSLTAESPPTDPPITLEPGRADRVLGLRVTGPGQLEGLIRVHEESARATEPRTMPARMVSYRRPEASSDTPTSAIGERWIVFEPNDTSRLVVQDIPAVAKTLRKALMSVSGAGGAEIPEFISGHRPRTGGDGTDTAPSRKPHLMILGLPFVGHHQATGEVMAVALVLPPSGDGADVDTANREVLNKTVQRFIEERDGRLTFKGGKRPVRLATVQAPALPYSATIDRWTRPSDTWVSVTPVALGRNPGKLGHADGAKRDAAAERARQSIATACERIGLPRPADIEISLDSLVRGTRPVHAFPPARTGRLTRVQVHARLQFAEPVRGPIVLGAGRYHGLGLFAPLGPSQTRTRGELA